MGHRLKRRYSSILGGDDGKSGDSTEVRSESESRVKGDIKELNRWRRRDDLTVISDALWYESVALSPFKEHPNRFGAA